MGDGSGWRNLVLRDPKGISRWAHHSCSHAGTTGSPRAHVVLLDRKSVNPEGRIDPEELRIWQGLGARLEPKGNVPDSIPQCACSGPEM